MPFVIVSVHVWFFTFFFFFEPVHMIHQEEKPRETWHISHLLPLKLVYTITPTYIFSLYNSVVAVQ